MTEGQTNTVLIVDDAAGIVEIYARWLRDDHEVLTATDGESALSTIDGSVDAVLIDHDLPTTSAAEVVETIRDRDLDPGIVVLSSVEPEFGDVEVDYHACLIKPVLRRELVEAVERAIAGKATETSDPMAVDPDPESGDSTESSDRPAGDPGSDEDVTAVSTEEITDRIESIRENLEETADDLYERNETADGDDESGDGGEDAESGSADAEESDDGPGDGGGDEGEETGESVETGSDGDPPEEGDSDADTDDEEKTLPSNGSEDAPGTQEDDGTAGEASLQERVERLASQTIDLADGDADPSVVLDDEDDGGESGDDAENADAQDS